MITKPNLTSENLSQQEEAMSKAVVAVQNSEKQNVSKTARAFKVPPGTLRDRLNGVPSRLFTRKYRKKLYPEEEEVLVDELVSMDSRGYALKPKDVAEMANLVLAHRGSVLLQRVGHNWATTFIKRQERLGSILSAKRSHKNASCEDPELLRSWLSLVQRKVSEFAIDRNDIYNVDDFGLGMRSGATAPAENGKRKAALDQSGHNNWASAIECVSASGRALPPCIVFKGAAIDPECIEEKPHDWVLEASSSGHVTNDIALRWLETMFLPCSGAHQVGTHRLLFFEGHASRLTPRFLSVCEQNRVIALCLPASLSKHLLPLAGTCFSKVRDAYAQKLVNMLGADLAPAETLDYMLAYLLARSRGLDPRTILSGFQYSGAVPYNPDRVVANLKSGQQSVTPPSSPGKQWVPRTPTNCSEVDKQIQCIFDHLPDEAGPGNSLCKTMLAQVSEYIKATMNRAEAYRKQSREMEQELYQWYRERRECEREQESDFTDLADSGLNDEHVRPLKRAKTSKNGARKCGICRVPGHRRDKCKGRTV